MAKQTEPRLSDLIDVNEAARRLGITKEAVHMSIGRKKLFPVYVGSHVLLTKQEVARYEKENSRGRAAPPKVEQASDSGPKAEPLDALERAVMGVVLSAAESDRRKRA